MTQRSRTPLRHRRPHRRPRPRHRARRGRDRHRRRRHDDRRTAGDRRRIRADREQRAVRRADLPPRVEGCRGGRGDRRTEHRRAVERARLRLRLRRGRAHRDEPARRRRCLVDLCEPLERSRVRRRASSESILRRTSQSCASTRRGRCSSRCVSPIRARSPSVTRFSRSGARSGSRER